jgi:hypothetical protein
MRYVQDERKDEGCIFCLGAEAGDDETRLIPGVRWVLTGSRRPGYGRQGNVNHDATLLVLAQRISAS